MELSHFHMKPRINQPNNHQSNRAVRGFTLIELLVVIAIIGILSSIVIGNLNSARDRASVVKAASDLKQLVLVLNLYQSSNNGAYPCFDHAWDDAKEKTWSAPYISTWPRLPWGNQYHWEHSQQGFTFSISMNAPGQANAVALDKIMDDDNLATGIMRGDGNRLEYSGIDQSVSLIDCHI